MSDTCLICNRIEMIISETNPYFVAELETGYVVIGDDQFFRGYTLFLCKEHVYELHELDTEFRTRFLNEMAQVSEAVFRAFKPKKLNYELLGNGDPHLHWHLFPRHENDPKPLGPIWDIDKSLRQSYKITSAPEDLLQLKRQLLKKLKKTSSIRKIFS